jgi:hypothetical protein
MADPTRNASRDQLMALLHSFALAPGIPFGAVFDLDYLQQVIAEEVADLGETIYTPLATLCIFVSQVTSLDHSCRAAVARFLAWRLGVGLPACSANDGAYCKARKRLPEDLPKRLALEGGRRLQAEAPEDWLFHGRVVKIVDGTGASMPDTPANQAAYPQPGGQAKGCGFPVARILVVISLACGAVLDAAIGPTKGKKTGENMLFRDLHAGLDEGDIVLGDRYFGSYWELALLRERGVDSVMRIHQLRKVDFGLGRRLGREDHVVRWPKPARPDWMDEATYAALADGLEVRELRVRVAQRGFRTRSLVVATTLLDASEYTAAEIGSLYRARWNIELDIRSLKQTLGMDILRCMTPEMVRKEIWCHLMVYNLVRTTMAGAAAVRGSCPRSLSFCGARQTLEAFGDSLRGASGDRYAVLVDAVLGAIATHRVGDRPDRYEPRVKKRRPKQYPLMKIPRAELKRVLAEASETKTRLAEAG